MIDTPWDPGEVQRRVILEVANEFVATRKKPRSLHRCDPQVEANVRTYDPNGEHPPHMWSLSWEHEDGYQFDCPGSRSSRRKLQQLREQGLMCDYNPGIKCWKMVAAQGSEAECCREYDERQRQHSLDSMPF